MGIRLLGAVLRGLTSLPRPLRRLVAGPPVRLDGQILDLDVQVMLRVLRPRPGAPAPPLTEQRRLTDAASVLAEQVTHGVRTRELTVPAPARYGQPERRLAARLYEPEDLPDDPSGLLVYFHGGGFVLGSLVSGDPLCRTLAQQASVRVLSVDYRLAPEHPFPAGLADAVAALRHALAHAREYGADPEAVAVGGDSAGANLALTAAHLVARHEERSASFVLAMYPVTDVARSGGSRELFGQGFGLSAADIAHYEQQYLPDGIEPIRPTGLLEVDDVALMPPTYLATAGFDPLRDEGEELAVRLREHGVPVVARRFPGLVHGYAGLNGLSRAAHDAVLDAASALRAGLALAGPRSGTRRVVRPTPARG
jgi:acetyl esterase